MYNDPGAVLPRNQRLPARSMPASAVFGPTARRLPLYVNASAPVSSQPDGPLEVIWLDGPFYSQSSSSLSPPRALLMMTTIVTDAFSSNGRREGPRMYQPLALVRQSHPPSCVSFVLAFSRWWRGVGAALARLRSLGTVPLWTDQYINDTFKGAVRHSLYYDPTTKKMNQTTEPAFPVSLAPRGFLFYSSTHAPRSFPLVLCVQAEVLLPPMDYVLSRCHAIPGHHHVIWPLVSD